MFYFYTLRIGLSEIVIRFTGFLMSLLTLIKNACSNNQRKGTGV